MPNEFLLLLVLTTHYCLGLSKRLNIVLRHTEPTSGSDIESIECELPQEANCANRIEGNRHPHTAKRSKLQDDVNAFNLERRILSGGTLNSPYMKCACFYPNLPSQEVSVFPLGNDSQNVLRDDADVVLPKKDEVVVRSTDLAAMPILCRPSF
jgi:hypothetical protein